MAVDVMIVSVARGHWERCEVGLFKVCAFTGGNPRVGRIRLAEVDQEPTSCARNLVVAQAKLAGLRDNDLIFMLDNDHSPNLQFFDHAANWLATHPGPACIGSPYCGSRAYGPGAPDREVQVVARDVNGVIRRVSRAEAALKTGTEEVVLVGTGVFAANMHAFQVTPEPHFDYGYDSPAKIKAIQTDDFHFCAKLVAAGGKVWCAWDHWSLHHKVENIGKPEPEIESFDSTPVPGLAEWTRKRPEEAKA